jgi:putative MATE family efflux protein
MVGAMAAPHTPRRPPVSTGRLLRLAGSAFVVLCAEPSFVLVDTAVVGHLGPVPLGALGIGGTLVSLVAIVGVFLDYGTTGRAARWFGAGDRTGAVDEGVAASVLAVVLGVVAVVAGEVLADPVLGALAGGNAAVAHAAVDWFRIAVPGIPGMLLVLAGNGWMRGVQENRQPVRIVVLANVLSAVASPLLVYPAGLGLTGSAVANAGAQTLAGLLFVLALRREGRPWRPPRSVLAGQVAAGRELIVRQVGFQAALLTAAAVAARMGTTVLGAHQIALQLWELAALLLDSFAIAAQSLVGAALGGGDAGEAHRVAWRVAGYGLAAGSVIAVLLAAGWELIPAAFSDSAGVRAQAHVLWPWFLGMQPAAGVVFALDGVLIGAGDVRFMRSITLFATVGVYAPIALAALHWHWGVGGIWAGLTASIAVRLVGMLGRTRSQRWVRLGVDA